MVAAVLCVPVVYALGVRLFGTPAGLLAAVLISTNVFFLEYAQYARSYALLALLTVLSSYFFIAELERPRTSSRVGYIVFSVLAFYAHAFAIWVLFVQLLTLAVFKRREAISRTWLTSFALIAALIAPMAYTLHSYGGKRSIGSKFPTWARSRSFRPMRSLQGIASFILGLAWWCARLHDAEKRLQTTGLRPRLHRCLGLSPSPRDVCGFGSTTAGLHRQIPDRLSLPAMVLLAAGAIVNIRPVRGAVIAACLLVALSAPEVYMYYDSSTQRSAARTGYPVNEIGDVDLAGRAGGSPPRATRLLQIVASVSSLG